MDKTGTVSAVSSAPLDKTGTLPPDHVDAQSVKTGTVKSVLHASVEDNGTLSQENAHAPTETGTVSHAFNVLLGKDGIHHLSHAHALKIPFGTVSIAELAQAQAGSGISNSTIVSAEQETGTVPNVLFALPTPTGMEELALLAVEVDFGTLWT